jgi:hypothetical protein
VLHCIVVYSATLLSDKLLTSYTSGYVWPTEYARRASWPWTMYYCRPRRVLSVSEWRGKSARVASHADDGRFAVTNAFLDGVKCTILILISFDVFLVRWTLYSRKILSIVQ